MEDHTINQPERKDSAPNSQTQLRNLTPKTTAVSMKTSPGKRASSGASSERSAVQTPYIASEPRAALSETRNSKRHRLLTAPCAQR